MQVSRRVWLLAALATAVPAWGQGNQRDPHIGYLYPAGGQRGTRFEVLVGGQYLRGVRNAYVTGEGVQATILEYYPPLRNLNGDQRRELQRQFRELIQLRTAEALSEDSLTPTGRELARRRGLDTQPKPDPKNGNAAGVANSAQSVELPRHYLLRDLENKSLKQLLSIREELLNARRRQPNPQIAETVLLEVVIDATAEPGDRELRLDLPAGLTNPMRFQVGLLPEVNEQEPNDPKPVSLVEDEPPLTLPFTMNGQIKPGDVDRFRFKADKGQRLVMAAHARHLIPYLADAVPGWFQATLSLYDEDGNEVAFSDDYRFDPDPVLLYEVPESGSYELEIRDSIYRGREDFVYRMTVGEEPFITESFPLGVRAGAKSVVAIDGWNLPGKRLVLNNEPGGERIREAAARKKDQRSNPVSYAVDMLPELSEKEPNDTIQDAQRIVLPRIINGRIEKPGDVDVFAFTARAGDQVVIEVHARRLLSPLDSLIRLTDETGTVLAWNDDYEDRESGLCTHHADSYLATRLPDAGQYYVHLVDAQNHGGDAYAYRLRISAPRPGFSLRLTPSSINARPGMAAMVCVYALRQDGFNGDIIVTLDDAPPGFRVDGGIIPSGRDRVCMTITAPPVPTPGPVTVQLKGAAKIGKETIERPVIPCEDMMQAFIYRHLVPSQELMVSVSGRRGGPPLALAEQDRVRIPSGGQATVRFSTSRRPGPQNTEVELREAPEGLSLEEVTAGPDGLAIVLKAADDQALVGLADNLIIEAFSRSEDRKRRISLGLLPAIPFEIVE